MAWRGPIDKMYKAPKNIPENLWKRIKCKLPNGCWIFDHPNKSTGYGEMMINYKRQMAHRLSYEMIKGLIPKGFQIDHLCRNRACINPDHLEAVTVKTNVLRGISWSGNNFRKTHCKNGHAFDESNTFYRKTGGRSCRKCMRKTSKKWKTANPDYWKKYK